MVPPLTSIANERLTLHLTGITISQTYGGLIEGVPCQRLNDRKLAQLVERAVPGPVHLIDPPRTRSDRQDAHYAPGTLMGPMENLPPVQCIGHFEGPCTSKAAGSSFDHWFAELTIIWFQQPSDALIHPDLVPSILAVPWDALAHDVSFDDM